MYVAYPQKTRAGIGFFLAKGPFKAFVWFLVLVALNGILINAHHPLASASDQVPAVETPLPISLEKTIVHALRYNPGLFDQKNALASARLSLDATRTDFEIQIVPAGSAGISGGDGLNEHGVYSAGIAVSRNFPSGTQVTVSPQTGKYDSDDGSVFANSVGIELTQPLLRGLNREYNLSGVMGAECGVRSARRRYFLSQVDVVVQSVAAFYNNLLQRQLVRNRRQSVGRLEAFTRSAKIKREIGLATAEDEYRATQKLKQARDDLVASEQALKKAEDTLKQILGWPMSRPISVQGDLDFQKAALNEAQTVATALEMRVEIDQARDALTEQHRLSRDAAHRLLPDLDISLYCAVNGESSSFASAAAMDDTRWGISLSTSTDLFRHKEKAAYRKSLLAVEDAKRNLATLRDDIVRQVRETIRNLNESAARIELQQSRSRDAERQLEISRFKFKYGMANNFDLIEAEAVYSAAQTNVNNAKVQYLVGLYRLRAAMGTLLPSPEQDQ